PTRLGIEMSQNVCPTSNAKPAAGSEITTIDQSCQTTNPRNSAKIDQRRLRLAMRRPPDSHCPSSSASQPSIHRPALKVSEPTAVTGAVRGAAGESIVVMGSPMLGCLPDCSEIRKAMFPEWAQADIGGVTPSSRSQGASVRGKGGLRGRAILTALS